MRNFESIREELLPVHDGVVMKPYTPERSTSKSACYDLRSLSEGFVMPGQTVMCRTGLKAHMNDGEALMMYSRSGMGVKSGIVLANGTGVIDADYADNPTNDGELLVALRNEGKAPYQVHIGDKIAQCMFIAVAGEADGTVTRDVQRKGGFGSTAA